MIRYTQCRVVKVSNYDLGIAISIGINFMSRICIFIALVMVSAAYVHHRAQIGIVGIDDPAASRATRVQGEAPQVSSIKMDLVAVLQ